MQSFDSSYTKSMKHLSANDIPLTSSMIQEFQNNNNNNNNHLQQYMPKFNPKNNQINPSPTSSPVNSFSPSFSQSSSSPSLSISPMSIYDNKNHNSLLSTSPSINQHSSKPSSGITPNDQLQYRSFGRSLLADYCTNGYQPDFALMGCSRFNIERIKRDLEASIRYSYFSKPINHSTCIIADVDNYQCHIIECILDDSVDLDNENGIDDIENEELSKYQLDNENKSVNSDKDSNQRNSMAKKIPSIEINGKYTRSNGSSRVSNNSSNRISSVTSNSRFLGTGYRSNNHSNGNSYDGNRSSHENINTMNSSGIPINIKSSRSSLNVRRNPDYHCSLSPYESTSLSLSYTRHHHAQVYVPTITSTSNSSADLSPLKFRIDRPQASNFVIKMLTELKGIIIIFHLYICI